MTGGYRLPARFVIHTVGPVWTGGDNGEAELLNLCYHRCMMIARENSLGSIAFPGISTGVYGYPVEQAASIAVRAVRKALDSEHVPEKVVFCCFSGADLAVYQRLIVD